MPTRTSKHTDFSTHYNSLYRYGFQGQEKDDEVAGEGNSYTAEFWQYDSRIGRRWNIDPVVKYHESPYATFANNPIWFIDPNGADTLNVTSTSVDANGKKSGEAGDIAEGLDDEFKGLKNKKSKPQIGTTTSEKIELRIMQHTNYGDTITDSDELDSETFKSVSEMKRKYTNVRKEGGQWWLDKKINR